MNKILLKTCILSILIASCKLKNAPDSFGVNTRPSLTGPLVDVNLTLKDVVNSQGVIPDLIERSDKVYVLSYRDTVFSDTISKYIKLENQSFSGSFQVPAVDLGNYNTNAAFAQKVSVSDEIDFAVSNAEQRFTAIDFKSGVLTLKFDSDFPYDMEFGLDFPDLRKGNAPMSILETIPARRKGFTITIDLAGYSVDLTKNGSTQNKLRYLITYTLKKQAGPPTPITVINNNFSVSGSITNLKYKYLAGYLGEITLPAVSSSIQVELFKNFVESKISFSEPVIRVGFDNSAGIDASVQIDPLLIKFAKRNNDSIIKRDNIPGLLDTVIAGPAFGSQNDTVVTNVVWNAQNSNIEFAFEPSPFDVFYKAKIILNKKTGAQPKLNFITDKSIVRVRAEVELPAIATLYYLTVSDTVDIAGEKGLESFDFDFDSATFKLNTENGFALDCKLQVYFMDSLKVIKDSLITNFNKALLPAATISPDGKIVSKSQQYYQRSFSKSQYDANIKRAKYIYVVGKLNSAKNSAGVPQSIKIYSDNTLRVKLSGQVKAIVKASTNDN